MNNEFLYEADSSSTSLNKVNSEEYSEEIKYAISNNSNVPIVKSRHKTSIKPSNASID